MSCLLVSTPSVERKSSLKAMAEGPRTPTRHSEFWFNDGSIVLVARNVLFRVHKTFLARHSSVFRDMFSLPQPQSSGPPPSSASSQSNPIVDHCSGKCTCSSATVNNNSSSPLPKETQLDFTTLDGEAILDGCPVVCLHDSPDDVESLLYALYDGPKFGNNSCADFRVISGILRLASKYELDALRAPALAHLRTAWPATLKGWDAREEISGAHEDERFYPNPVEVINLAREVNAPDLLPSAFYDLSRNPLTEVFNNASPSHSAQGSDMKDLTTLSLPDTQRLALGKEAAHHAVTSLIRSLATDARSNPSHTHSHHLTSPHSGHGTPRGFAARHRRDDSGLGRCAAPAACWRDVCELVDLATQHYLFDRERGAADPLYVAEELALLKGSVALSEFPSGAGGVNIGAGGNGAAGRAARVGVQDEDFLLDGESGTCRACARAVEAWAVKERERLWRAIPGWFKLEQ